MPLPPYSDKRVHFNACTYRVGVFRHVICRAWLVKVVCFVFTTVARTGYRKGVTLLNIPGRCVYAVSWGSHTTLAINGTRMLSYHT